jgi:hypothetical protein
MKDLSIVRLISEIYVFYNAFRVAFSKDNGSTYRYRVSFRTCTVYQERQISEEEKTILQGV